MMTDKCKQVEIFKLEANKGKTIRIKAAEINA